MFGAHCSIAGGLENALVETKRCRMDCVQIFTKNQRQWRCPPLSDDQCGRWFDALRAMPWSGDRARNGEAHRVIAHNSYLINLATADPVCRSKSIAAQRSEMENCERLSIPLLVAHPGAHLGTPRPRTDRNRLDGTVSRDERAGLTRIARALDRLHEDLSGYRVITCLETTVGAGTNLGYDFHHLRMIRDMVKEPERIGFCLDTCHVTAAGYDMTADEKAAGVLDHWDQICGFENLHVIHMNDSLGAVGSRLDRHAHIGHGRCGRACFRAIVNHPLLRGVGKILETPKGINERGVSLDLVNIRRLKRLMKPPGIADGNRAALAARSARSRTPAREMA